MSEPTKPTAGRLVGAVAASLASLVEYSPDSIVSRTLYNASTGTLTLFAFDDGQTLSEHTSPFDAFVQVLDGAVELTIGGESVPARTGEIVLMPGGVPHAVRATGRFKMLLTMYRK